MLTPNYSYNNQHINQYHALYRLICSTWISLGAEVNNGSVICGYGSEFHENVYLWKHRVRPNKYLKRDIFCDSCVEELEAKGIIVLEQNKQVF